MTVWRRCGGHDTEVEVEDKRVLSCSVFGLGEQMLLARDAHSVVFDARAPAAVVVGGDG